MKFWFSDDMTGENSVGGWSDRALGPFERHDSFLHFLRRYSIRYRASPPSLPELSYVSRKLEPSEVQTPNLDGSHRKGICLSSC